MFRNLSTIGLPLSGRPTELIELALSFGFDGMDIDIIDFQQQAEVYGVAHARRLMVSARLKSGMFQLPVHLTADDATFAEDLKALPARLEVVEGSAAANVPADFTATTGDDGATVLTWRLRETLPAGASGFVRFRTLVR